jgi:GntR family transcriptional regulator / MocR family aminotransferase
VARGVVVDAYEQLAAEGLLQARTGVGTFVAPAAGLRASARSAPPLRVLPGVGPALPSQPHAELRPGVPSLSGFPRALWGRAVRHALVSVPDSALGYGDPCGYPPLREELADYLTRVRGARVRAEAVIVTGGVAQALSLISRVLRERGERQVAVEDPGSPGAWELLRSFGLAPVPVPVDDDGLDVARLVATGARAVVVTPAHQYPLGVVLAPARRRALVEWARERGGLVVEDDYDAEFRYDRAPVGCVQGLGPDVTLLTGSVSKALAPALRLGWLVAPDALRGPLAAAKRTADLGTPVLDQAALAHLLATGDYDRHLRQARRRYRHRRDALVAALRARLPRLPVRGVEAGLHLVVELPAEVGEERLLKSLADRGVVLHGLSATRIRPGVPGLVLAFADASPDRLQTAVSTLATRLRADGAPVDDARGHDARAGRAGH